MQVYFDSCNHNNSAGELFVHYSHFSCLILVAVFCGLSEGHMKAAGVLTFTAVLGVTGYFITRSQLRSSGNYI